MDMKNAGGGLLRCGFLLLPCPHGHEKCGRWSSALWFSPARSRSDPLGASEQMEKIPGITFTLKPYRKDDVFTFAFGGRVIPDSHHHRLRALLAHPALNKES